MRLVPVGFAGVNAKLAQLLPCEGTVRHHAADGFFNHALGMLALEDFFRRGCFDAAGITGVAVVLLVRQLASGENRLFRIDDDDVVTAIHVGSVVGLVLAAQARRYKCRKPPDHNALGVNYEPLGVEISGFRGESLLRSSHGELLHSNKALSSRKISGKISARLVEMEDGHDENDNCARLVEKPRGEGHRRKQREVAEGDLDEESPREKQTACLCGFWGVFADEKPGVEQDGGDDSIGEALVGGEQGGGETGGRERNALGQGGRDGFAAPAGNQRAEENLHEQSEQNRSGDPPVAGPPNRRDRPQERERAVKAQAQQQKRHGEVQGEPVGINVDAVLQAARDHIPSQRALPGSEQKDQREFRQHGGRKISAQRKPRERQEKCNADESSEGPMRPLPPIDGFKSFEGHVRIDDPVLRDLPILAKGFVPFFRGCRRKDSGNGQPLRDGESGIC